MRPLTPVAPGTRVVLGVSFFVLEKMAAVPGVSNPEVYAAFRGESLAQFLATRKVPMTYSVAGGDRARAIGGQ